ncbi:MAG TPA: patatin-like phospholipase family protein [Polyangiaceae bacterium]|jgi:NTE family protein|nr:patatin-like phospholipase family protein [Polyangiaceae bacterium]
MTLRQWLESAPFTLAMSSGFFGFFAHAGVLSVLEEERLLPARVAGSSAGALVTGFWASGVTARELVRELLRIDRRDFWDPGFGPGLLRGRLFESLLERLLPVRTFAACRVPLRVSVFDVATLRTRVLDSGALAPALRASCAVPGMFHPVLHEGRALYDGGILDRPGLAGVGASERVFYHHLASRLPLARLHGALGRDIPRRRELVPLVIPELPRCDPFRLEEAPRVVELAMAATRRELDRDVSPPRV